MKKINLSRNVEAYLGPDRAIIREAPEEGFQMEVYVSYEDLVKILVEGYYDTEQLLS